MLADVQQIGNTQYDTEHIDNPHCKIALAQNDEGSDTYVSFENRQLTTKTCRKGETTVFLLCVLFTHIQCFN